MRDRSLQRDTEVLLDQRLERALLTRHTREAVHLLAVAHEDAAQPRHERGGRVSKHAGAPAMRP